MVAHAQHTRHAGCLQGSVWLVAAAPASLLFPSVFAASPPLLLQGSKVKETLDIEMQQASNTCLSHVSCSEAHIAHCRDPYTNDMSEQPVRHPRSPSPRAHTAAHQPAAAHQPTAAAAVSNSLHLPRNTGHAPARPGPPLPQIRRMLEARLAALQQQHGQLLDSVLQEARQQLDGNRQLLCDLQSVQREFDALVEHQLQRCAEAQAGGAHLAGAVAAGMLTEIVNSQSRSFQQLLLPAVTAAGGQLARLGRVEALPPALLDDAPTLRAQLAAAQQDARAAQQRAQAADQRAQAAEQHKQAAEAAAAQLLARTEQAMRADVARLQQELEQQREREQGWRDEQTDLLSQQKGLRQQLKQQQGQAQALLARAEAAEQQLARQRECEQAALARAEAAEQQLAQQCECEQALLARAEAAEQQLAQQRECAQAALARAEAAEQQLAQQRECEQALLARAEAAEQQRECAQALLARAEAAEQQLAQQRECEQAALARAEAAEQQLAQQRECERALRAERAQLQMELEQQRARCQSMQRVLLEEADLAAGVAEQLQWDVLKGIAASAAADGAWQQPASGLQNDTQQAVSRGGSQPGSVGAGGCRRSQGGSSGGGGDRPGDGGDVVSTASGQEPV